jgi:hypothetical protein
MRLLSLVVSTGKSLFGLYFVRRLLQRRWPTNQQLHHVVWQTRQVVWLFNINDSDSASHPNSIQCFNITKVHLDYANVYRRDRNTISIYDAPTPLADMTGALAVLLTSPKDKQTAKEFQKSAQWKWMPIWTAEEMQDCRELVYNDQTDQARYTAVYKYYGNNPRHVFTEHLAPHIAESQAELTLKKQIKKLSSPSQLMSLLDAVSAGETVDDKSHLILHLHSTAPYDLPRADWATSYVAQQVLHSLTRSQHHKLELFLAASRGLGDFAALRGVLFEWFAHEQLAAGGDFRCERLSPGLPRQMTFHLQRSTVRFWSDVKELRHLSDTEYAVPYSRSQGAIDAAMKPNRLFQMTVATGHSIAAHHASTAVTQLGSDEPPDFIFVLPSDIYPSFNNEQALVDLKIAAKEVEAAQFGQSLADAAEPIKRVPANLQHMRQWKLVLPFLVPVRQLDGSEGRQEITEEVVRQARVQLPPPSRFQMDVEQ